MNVLELAYAAGVIDSDGCIGINRSTYAMRVRKDASQPIFSERITMKQVEPQAVALLHGMFKGHRGVTDPSAKRGRPLFTWHIHSASAGAALVELLPYLRIKRQQAENAIQMRAIMLTRRKWPVPDIIDGEPMISASEFARRVGVRPDTISQAVSWKSVPSIRVGRTRLLPVSFVATYSERMANGGKPTRSAEITAVLEQHYLTAKHLNRVGIR